ncbi:hypothetical protein J7K50_02855 [bacterium]|nr:hypothetical protein [bacterium]
MRKMHDETLERLRHWLELAEDDRAIGDGSALSSKLMLIRAEVENALDLGIRPAASPEAPREFRFKLAFKYAVAAMLLIIALGVMQLSRVSNPVTTGEIANVSSDVPLINGGSPAGVEGSDGSGVPEISAFSEGASDVFKEDADDATTGLSKPSEGRRNTSLGGNSVGRRGIENGSRIAAADAGFRAAPLVEQPAATEAHEPPPDLPSSDESAGHDTQSSDGEGGASSGRDAAPKLDPLSLIAALDSHFE